MRKQNQAMCLLCLLCVLAMPVGVRAETIFDPILGALRLKDVTTAAEAGAIPAPSSPETGDVLVWDGEAEAWVNGSAPAATIDSLDDVSLTAPTTGQALVYDEGTGEWANATVGGSGSVTATAWDGSNWTATDTAPSQSAVQGALPKSAHFAHEVANNGDGGTATHGSWYTRVINTTRHNSIGAALASNLVTIPAGTYRFSGYAVGYQVGAHQCRVYDADNELAIITGSSVRSPASTALPSTCNGVWHFPVETDVALQQIVASTVATTGQGAGAGLSGGLNEVFAELFMQSTILPSVALTMAVDPSGTTIPSVGESVVPATVGFVIKATPAEGKQFSEWTVTGGATVASSSTNPTTAKLTAAGTITAAFVDIP